MMNVSAFPLDEMKRERLLLRLDVELLENVAHMIAVIDRSVSPEIKEALAVTIGTLVDLARAVPHLPAQNPHGDLLRNAIYLHCLEMFEAVLAHSGGRLEDLSRSE